MIWPCGESTRGRRGHDTRTNYEATLRKSTRCTYLEGILDVPHSHAFLLDQHAYDVEPVRVVLPSVAVDPDQSRAGQFSLLSPPDGFDGLAKLRSSTRFHLHEGHEPVTLHDEVDVAMTASEATHEHAPSLSPQPPFRHSLAQLAECPSLRCHGRASYAGLVSGASPFGCDRCRGRACSRVLESRANRSRKPPDGTFRVWQGRLAATRT